MALPPGARRHAKLSITGAGRVSAARLDVFARRGHELSPPEADHPAERRTNEPMPRRMIRRQTAPAPVPDGDEGAARGPCALSNVSNNRPPVPLSKKSCPRRRPAMRNCGPCFHHRSISRVNTSKASSSSTRTSTETVAASPAPVTTGPFRPSGCARRSEEHTSELQSRLHLVCRLLLEKKKHKQARLHACDIDP